MSIALGAFILAIAFLKARLILIRCLGLAEAPFWRQGSDILGLLILLLLALHAAPALV